MCSAEGVAQIPAAGGFSPQDVHLMAQNNNLSLQALMRLEATPDISQQKVYWARHRI
jgi:hypothetical protein